MDLNFTNLPKIELHLHLDCSLSYEVVKKLDPAVTFQNYNDEFIAPSACTGLADYIERAGKGIELMQTEEQLRLVTYDLFDQLKKDNVIYAEIRFAPLLHTSNGLAADKVVEIVNSATEESIRSTGVEAGIILCTLRHYSEMQSMQTVQLVKKFKGTKVVGFDIAADEAGHPIDNHIGAFSFAKANGIHCTAHAGEAKGAESVWETLIHFGPDRIGHGIRSAEDPKLINHLRAHDIHLEICPTSNVLTKVFNRIEDHNIDFFYQQDISVSINTDGRTISNVTLADEYRNLHTHFNWHLNQLKKCNIEAIKHSFAPESLKKKLQNKIIDGYKEL